MKKSIYSILCVLLAYGTVWGYQTDVHFQVVAPTFVDTSNPPHRGHIILSIDICPHGDRSMSLYDGVCAGEEDPIDIPLGINYTLIGSFLRQLFDLQSFASDIFFSQQHMIAVTLGLSVQYHALFDKLSILKIQYQSDIIPKLSKLYQIPWKKGSNIINYNLDKQDFVYFTCILRSFLGKKIYFSDETDGDIKKLSGYISKKDAIKFIQKYVVEEE